MVRFTRGIVVAMNVWMVSSAMTMIERAHDIDRMRSNGKMVITIAARKIIFPPFGQCGVQIGAVPNR